MGNSSREFQVFVKPVGSSCNLRCSYCYYLEKKDLYPYTKSFRMSDEILENYIIQHIEATTDKVIFFSWHGGEPILAGLDFYKKAVRLQKKYLPAGKSIQNGIQTNGTLLSIELCRFFADENFIVGISMDGPEEFHNKHRRMADKKTSFNQVLDGYRRLQKHGIITEILCVLNSNNSQFPLVIYDYFKLLGSEYITFLPLVDRQKKSATGVSHDSVSPEDFGRFLCVVFDEWVQKDIGRIKIQLFEEAARTAFNQEHTLCIFKVRCGGVPVIEHNGDFYSCDHYVDKEHFLGNISERRLSDFLDSPEQKAFGEKKSETLPVQCIECSVREMCNGECPKNRFINTQDGESGLNYLCSGYKLFFNHCLPFIEAIRETRLKTGGGVSF
jgi:uncharacterized protein